MKRLNSRGIFMAVWLLVAMLVDSSNSAICYDCISTKAKGCSDKFNSDDIGVCSGATCLKIVITYEATTVVSRECNNKVSSGNLYGNSSIAGITVEAYGCTTDYCNSAKAVTRTTGLLETTTLIFLAAAIGKNMRVLA